MKLLKKINPKNLSPTRVFRSKKDRSVMSRSNPSSFSSGTTSSSASDTSSHNNIKPDSLSGPRDIGTPTSVLPEISSCDWSDMSSDIHFELVQAFKLIDRDNDGTVSRAELEALLSRLGAEPPSQEEVSLMVNEVDEEGDGCIRLEALLSQLGSAYGPACVAELRETFDFFDTDHDGRISADELFGVFATIGDGRCTLEDCQRMIAGVDNNKDGFVCFEDFSRMMEQHR